MWIYKKLLFSALRFALGMTARIIVQLRIALPASVQLSNRILNTSSFPPKYTEPAHHVTRGSSSSSRNSSGSGWHQFFQTERYRRMILISVWQNTWFFLDVSQTNAFLLMRIYQHLSEKVHSHLNSIQGVWRWQFWPSVNKNQAGRRELFL